MAQVAEFEGTYKKIAPVVLIDVDNVLEPFSLIMHSCTQIGCGHEPNPELSCQCNDHCAGSGNCCEDWFDECIIKQTCSWWGCGGEYNPEQPCQCNELCMQYGNCCDDYFLQCNGTFAIV